MLADKGVYINSVFAVKPVFLNSVGVVYEHFLIWIFYVFGFWGGNTFILLVTPKRDKIWFKFVDTMYYNYLESWGMRKLTRA